MQTAIVALAESRTELTEAKAGFEARLTNVEQELQHVQQVVRGGQSGMRSKQVMLHASDAACK